MRKFINYYQIITCKELNTSERCVLCAILNFEINLEFDNLSLTKIEEECGISKRTVQRTVITLEEKGLIKKVESSYRKTGKPTNFYEPNIEKIDELIEGRFKMNHLEHSQNDHIEYGQNDHFNKEYSQNDHINMDKMSISNMDKMTIDYNTNNILKENINNIENNSIIEKENTKEKEEHTPSIEEIEEREYELIKEYCVTKDDFKLIKGLKLLYRPQGWNNSMIQLKVNKIRKAVADAT